MKNNSLNESNLLNEALKLGHHRLEPSGCDLSGLGVFLFTLFLTTPHALAIARTQALIYSICLMVRGSLARVFLLYDEVRRYVVYRRQEAAAALPCVGFGVVWELLDLLVLVRGSCCDVASSLSALRPFQYSMFR